MKTKIMVALAILCALLFGTITLLNNQLTKAKKERDRFETNFFNANQELDSIVDENGSLHYTVGTLTLKKNEIEVTHSHLVDEAKNMGLKIKNLESLLAIKQKYIVKDSFIPTKMINDTTFISQRKDDWSDISWRSTLLNNGTSLKVNDFNAEIKDSLIINTEFTKKGWWIFKKITGAKVHVKSLNPYSGIEKIEYVRITK